MTWDLSVFSVRSVRFLPNKSTCGLEMRRKNGLPFPNGWEWKAIPPRRKKKKKGKIKKNWFWGLKSVGKMV